MTCRNGRGIIIDMLKIRLQRVGRRHDPSFRMILTDSRKPPRGGSYLELLGSYNARKGEPQFKAERIKHWLSKGAKTSDTVHNLLVDAEIIKGKKINVLPASIKEKAKKKEKPAEKEEKKE